MRKYIAIAVGCVFLLFAFAAAAQMSGSSGQYGSQSTTTESQTTTNSNSSGSQTIEGCLVKEQTDYFLIPQSGNPIKLEPNSSANYSGHEGHKVKVTGSKTAMSSDSSSASSSASGNDLHRMATEDMTVMKIQHIAATCPANWNPSVPSSAPTSSSPSGGSSY